MRIAAAASVFVMIGLAACGLSPEEQRVADQQGCAGYGFAPGTTEFANCMMSTAQQRSALEAAAARQRAAANAAAQQRDLDRQAMAREATLRSQAAATAGMPDMPSMPSMPSNMVCSGSQGANAGAMSCHSP